MATIIFHRSDYDGLLSGAICKRFCEQPSGQSPRMVAWEYGDPIPELSSGEVLYMVDLAIEELMNYPGLVWIDHHQTAIEKYPESLPGYRLDGVAACRLCWQWFTGDKPRELPGKAAYIDRVVDEPLLVRLVGEYDVWDRRDERSSALQLALRCEQASVDWFQDQLENDRADGEVSRLAAVGRTLEQYQQAIDGELVNERSYLLPLEGLRFLVLNTGRGNSQTFDGYKNWSEVDALLLWRCDGSRLIVSLYHAPHRKDIDLAPIARKYGGGGHRGACGFSMPSGSIDVLTSIAPSENWVLAATKSIRD